MSYRRRGDFFFFTARLKRKDSIGIEASDHRCFSGGKKTFFQVSKEKLVDLQSGNHTVALQQSIIRVRVLTPGFDWLFMMAARVLALSHLPFFSI